MIKVLITGGAGFIGKHLTNLLLSHNISVRILDNLSPQIHGDLPINTALQWLDNPSIEYIRGSVLDRAVLEKTLNGVSCIVHLAAETGTGQSMYEIAKYNHINSQGAAILFDVLANAKNHKVKRVVLSSSRSVYGEGAYFCKICGGQNHRLFPGSRSKEQLECHVWNLKCELCAVDLVPLSTREDDSVFPASIYAATKLAQEDLTRISCMALNIDYAILRLQNVYGEGQSLNNPYTGLLSIFSTRLRRGLDLPIFEDGQETRDFVHVSNVAEAMMACIISNSNINRTINVGSGVATSILDIATHLANSFKIKPLTRITSEYRIGDIRHNVADINKLYELIPEYNPLDIAQGLKQFTLWVQSQPLPKDFSERANSELRDRNLMG